MIGNWHRYRLNDPCRICGSKGWCLYEGPKENPTAVLCARVSEGAVRRHDGSLVEARNGQGWIHRLIDSPRSQQPRPAPLPPSPKEFLEPLARECTARITPGRLDELSYNLNLSSESLRRLGVGWMDEYPDWETGEIIPCRAWTFPMRDQRLKIIGIRTRSIDNLKRAVKGSINGMFIPSGSHRRSHLYIVEGPTDCAAAMDLGLDCIGRPSNTAGLEYLAEFVKRGRWDNVVVLKNNDPEGSNARRLTDRGAEVLADRLLRQHVKVRIIAPPITKDMRDWKNSEGASLEDVESAARRCRLHARI